MRELLKDYLNFWKEYWPAIGAATVVACIGFSGHMDARDAELQRAHYCNMVEQGAWPDYRGTYAEECL